MIQPIINCVTVLKCSSLHNIILNMFCVILVLWRLLESGLSFSFLRHSFSKKFLWRQKVQIEWVDGNAPPLQCERYISTRIFFRTTMTCERESLIPFNSLHNTKTTQNVFDIILWRLLMYILRPQQGVRKYGSPKWNSLKKLTKYYVGKGG